ncbi:MAG: hypothetical protein Q8M09_05595 [Pseudomonadota bacterium]|nr:hypothetical protein [Pseudomonadota bacterium]MDP1903706.1 hypothetical protein [Pseudomonadota bacterium]MDP2351235.1 hypothetical protein [Pseudomonadota bacterium]
MKQRTRILSGVLIALLAAVPAAAADRAKVAATKKRAGKAIAAPRPALPPVAASVVIDSATAEGLRLSLTTLLREPPAAAIVVPPPVVAAPVVVEKGASEAPSPVTPAATAPVPPAALPRGAAPTYSPPTYFPPVYTPRPVPVIGARAENPYLPRPLPRETGVERAVEPVAAAPQTSSGGFLSSLIPSIPLLPGSGQSILPKVTKVYPTGEKPLVVVSFKCPTEVVGITPPTIKILHEAVSLGMTGINKTDLLSFDLQQVCQ